MPSRAGGGIGGVKTEFEPATENAALKEAIVARIRAPGALTFRDFMDAALYHPQHGYYRSRREKMGREGDYLTTPGGSPIFGVLLGRPLRGVGPAPGRAASAATSSAGPARTRPAFAAPSPTPSSR